VTSIVTQTFAHRAQALAHFFERAGEAPRLVAFDDQLGCPLDTALAVLEWTGAVGILRDDDRIQAARLSGETAATLVERRLDGKKVFVYLGPRMDAPPADGHEGTLLYDEPGVRGYQFVQQALGMAFFLRATQGAGSAISVLSNRAPELVHIRRWLAAILKAPEHKGSSDLLAGWFATSGGGILFQPGGSGESYRYEEANNGD